MGFGILIIDQAGSVWLGTTLISRPGGLLAGESLSRRIIHFCEVKSKIWYFINLVNIALSRSEIVTGGFSFKGSERYSANLKGCEKNSSFGEMFCNKTKNSQRPVKPLLKGNLGSTFLLKFSHSLKNSSA